MNLLCFVAGEGLSLYFNRVLSEHFLTVEKIHMATPRIIVIQPAEGAELFAGSLGDFGNSCTQHPC